MRAPFFLVLLIGIGIAGYAVYMAKDYLDAGDQRVSALRSKINELEQQIVETGPVYIFKEGFRYGERFTPEDVEAVDFPVDAIPENSFTSIDQLFPEDGLAYRAMLRTVEAGEIIMPVKVSEPGTDAGIMYRLRPGNSAFAINVNATSGVSGFLRPGDNVNIFWTGTVQGQEITKLIMTNVNLIAIDQSADEDVVGARVANTVTVQGTQQEIAALQLAQSSGRLSLSLVRTGDTTTNEEVSTNLLDVLGIEVIEEVEPEPEVIIEEPQECFQTLTVRQGSETVERQFKVPCE